MKALKSLTALFVSAAFATSGFAATGPITRLHDADHDVLTLNDNSEVQLPHCIDKDKQPVRYWVVRPGGTDDLYGAGRPDWMIRSVRNPSPAVAIKSSFLDLPYRTAQFTVELECARHEQGQLARQLAATPGAKTAEDADRETYAADCIAAQRVRDKYGFTADDIKAAFAPFPANPPDHPPTAERLEKALACYGGPN